MSDAISLGFNYPMNWMGYPGVPTNNQNNVQNPNDIFGGTRVGNGNNTNSNMTNPFMFSDANLYNFLSYQAGGGDAFNMMNPMMMGGMMDPMMGGMMNPMMMGGMMNGMYPYSIPASMMNNPNYLSPQEWQEVNALPADQRAQWFAERNARLLETQRLLIEGNLNNSSSLSVAQTQQEIEARRRITQARNQETVHDNNTTVAAERVLTKIDDDKGDEVMDAFTDLVKSYIDNPYLKDGDNPISIKTATTLAIARLNKELQSRGFEGDLRAYINEKFSDPGWQWTKRNFNPWNWFGSESGRSDKECNASLIAQIYDDGSIAKGWDAAFSYYSDGKAPSMAERLRDKYGYTE